MRRRAHPRSIGAAVNLIYTHAEVIPDAAGNDV